MFSPRPVLAAFASLAWLGGLSLLAATGCSPSSLCAGSGVPAGRAPDVLLGLTGEPKRVDIPAPLPAGCAPAAQDDENTGPSLHTPTSVTVTDPSGARLPFTFEETVDGVSVLFTPSTAGLHSVRAVFQPNRGSGFAYLEAAAPLSLSNPVVLPYRCREVAPFAGGLLCDDRLLFPDGGARFVYGPAAADDSVLWSYGESQSFGQRMLRRFVFDGGALEEQPAEGLDIPIGEPASLVATRDSLEVLVGSSLQSYRVEDGGLRLSSSVDLATGSGTRLLGDGPRLFSVGTRQGQQFELNPTLCELLTDDAGTWTAQTKSCHSEEALFYSVTRSSAYFVGRGGGSDLEITRFVPTAAGMDRSRIALPRHGSLDTSNDLSSRGVPALPVPGGIVLPIPNGGELTLQFLRGDAGDFSATEDLLWIRQDFGASTRVYRRR